MFPHWIRKFAIKTYEKPTPSGPVIIELDEIWHFIKSKKPSAGYGRLIAELPSNSLTGNAEIVVAKL
jgi:hypothetical protein